MKFTKILLLVLFSGIISISLNSCKRECKGEPPQIRIINNGSTVINSQIQTSNGNTVNINNIAPGTSSAYSSYVPGDITFSITVDTINFIQNTSLGYCFKYDIAIDNNNIITVNPIEKKYQ